MKKLIVLALFFSALVVSCGDSEPEVEVEAAPTVESIAEDIKMLEDSIMRMSQAEEVHGKQMINLTRQQLHEKLKYGYLNFPESDKAPEYLAKLHMSYSAIGVDEMASRYADTLISDYVDYPDRRQIIESQIVYHSLKQPYEPKKVEELIRLVLDDKNANLSEEQVADYEYRLENIDLTMDQLIEKRMSELEN